MLGRTLRKLNESGYIVSNDSILMKASKLRNAVAHATIYYNVSEERIKTYIHNKDSLDFTEEDVDNILCEMRQFFNYFIYAIRKKQYAFYESPIFNFEEWDSKYQSLIEKECLKVIVKLKKINEQYL